MAKIIVLFLIVIGSLSYSIAQTTNTVYTQLKKILPQAKAGNIGSYKGKYDSADSGFILTKYYHSKIKIEGASAFVQCYVQKIKGKTNEIVSSLNIHFTKTDNNELLLNELIDKLKKEFEKKEKWRCTSGGDSMYAIYLPKDKLYIVVTNSSETEYILSIVNQPKGK